MTISITIGAGSRVSIYPHLLDGAPSNIEIRQKTASAVVAEPARCDGIVADPARGLEWSVAPIGGKRMTWSEADAACKALDLGGCIDWRLPTLAELQGLVDYSRHNPAIDPTLFPNTPAESFWTSSPDASDPEDYAWIVLFRHGGVNLNGRGLNAWVRAVRSAPASQ